MDNAQQAAAINQAAELGREHAEAAASWAADGNTSTEHIVRVLAMLDEGDPAVDDFMPRMPNLSGEFADDLTPAALWDLIVTDDLDVDPVEFVDTLASAYEDAVFEVFGPACEATLRGFLPETADA